MIASSLLWIFLCPFLAAITLPIFAQIHKKSIFLVSLASLLASLSFACNAILALRNQHHLRYVMGGWSSPMGIEWYLDAFSGCLIVLVLVVSFSVLLAHARNELMRLPFLMTALLHISGILGILLTRDLFNLFVFIEISSLTAYALIATGSSKKAGISSLRYLFIGSVGASFYLLGVGYLYSVTGTLNMDDTALRLQALSPDRSTILGMIFISTGLFMKMGLFPFHAWMPDSYQNASHPASSLLAPLMTKVCIYAFARIHFWIFLPSITYAFHINGILRIVGLGAILFAAYTAFRESKLKRLYAYSSIGHIGLICVALSLGTKAGLVAAILHMIHHALMKTGLFLASSTETIQSLQDRVVSLNQLRKQHSWILHGMSLLLLSLIGIPPLCGFFSKWFIATAAMQSGNSILMILVVASGLLTALYAFRILEQYFVEPTGEALPIIAESPYLKVVFFFITILVITMGAVSPFLYKWIYQTIPWALA